jgi:hypothetical protein
MCKQSACMTDQVTDTKSGTQSGLFTDCFTDNITSLKFDNRTDVLVQGTPTRPRQPKGSVLLSNFKLVMLSVKQSVNRPACVPDLVSVT